MKAKCEKSYINFKSNNYYNIVGIYSIFEKDDFISLEINGDIKRFRLNKSLDYIDDYIGMNETYFYDYFNILNVDRKNKLDKISKL